MVYVNDNGSITSNAAPRTVVGEVAIIADLQATIARLTDELREAEDRANAFATKEMHTERRAIRAEAERDQALARAAADTPPHDPRQECRSGKQGR